jgi:glycine cleavage system H protein
MSEVRDGLYYTQEHEWLRLEDDGTVLLGVTDHAQESMGELVFVEPADAGSVVAVGDPCGVVESVKAAQDVYSPIAGEVAEINDALADAPELVNSEPYDGGWIIRLKPENPADIEALMNADDYGQFVAESEH